MSADTCVNCGASAVILDADDRCAGCKLPENPALDAAVARLVNLGKQRDEQRTKLEAQWAASTDPVEREAHAMAKRAGFDWYDTESSARRAFEHAARELLDARPVYRPPVRVWVLTSAYNDYDQHGEYFEAVWPAKPTAEQVGDKLGLIAASSTVAHVLNGGGRQQWEDVWWHLREHDLRVLP